MLKMEQVEAIKRLSKTKTQTSVAEELGLDRKTVRKYERMDDFNETVESYLKKREMPSKLDPYKPEIDRLLDDEERRGVRRKQRFTAKRMHRYLVDEKGASELENSYSLVQRYMKERSERKAASYSDPGTLELVWHPAEAQADFGEVCCEVDGEDVVEKMFVLCFPNSNIRICVLMPGENCECVCTALQTIFEYVGGVPVRIVFDNATGIGRRICRTLRENVGFTRFRLHHGFETTFANPASGWEKGSVENAVGTLRRNLFVPIRKIPVCLMDYNLNTLLDKSFNHEADEPHYKKAGTPRSIFEAEDRPRLRPLPTTRFVVRRIDKVSSNGVGSVRIDAMHYYNLGPQYANSQLLVEKSAFKVIFHNLDGKVVKSFDRLYGDGVSEVYDIEAMLSALQFKAGAWRNSVVREEMEDGLLKDWLDACGGKDELRRSLGILSAAADEFGFADACLAAQKLLGNGHFPRKEDLVSMCCRMRQAVGLGSENPTGVELGVYDRLLCREAD